MNEAKICNKSEFYYSLFYILSIIIVGFWLVGPSATPRRCYFSVRKLFCPNK